MKLDKWIPSHLLIIALVFVFFSEYVLLYLVRRYLCYTKHQSFVWFDRPGESSRTVVGDIDWRFDNLSGSHHQSHVNCVSSVYGIFVINTNKMLFLILCCLFFILAKESTLFYGFWSPRNSAPSPPLTRITIPNEVTYCVTPSLAAPVHNLQPPWRANDAPECKEPNGG